MYVSDFGYEKISKAKVGDKIIITATELKDIDPTEVTIIEIQPELKGMDFVVTPKFKTAQGEYTDIVFNSGNAGEFAYADTWHFKEEEEKTDKDKISQILRDNINDQEKSRGTYKGVLYDLKDALSIAMTTQDEHDKEIYKRIYDYITERMREVDESRKENK